MKASTPEVKIMTKTKNAILAVCTGLITSALQLYLIPRFLMRGIPDMLWGALMLLLPLIPAVILLHLVGKCRAVYVFIGLLTESVIAVAFCKVVGGFLGFRLQSIAMDLFDYVAYLMFTIGLAAAATLLQFAVMLVIGKLRQSKML